jgi:SAM-dependent methyltransferase
MPMAKRTNPTMPHASWATHYDEAYRQSFGSAYAELTSRTLELIAQLVTPLARIIDFGAGTGRLTLPLAEAGYRVVAVEPCAEMLSVLESKTKEANLTIETIQGRMQDAALAAPCDLALCVFTVIAYITDEASLCRSFQAAASALQPGGLLLLDVPSKAVFSSYRTESPRLIRDVRVIAESRSTYGYEEIGRVQTDDGWVTYQDQFRIRHWKEDEVISALRGAGFKRQDDVSGQFAGSGSRYLLVSRETCIANANGSGAGR